MGVIKENRASTGCRLPTPGPVPPQAPLGMVFSNHRAEEPLSLSLSPSWWTQGLGGSGQGSLLEPPWALASLPLSPPPSYSSRS